jgi:hypothetical protein
MIDSRLLPCAHCGNKDIEIITENFFNPRSDVVQHIECEVCESGMHLFGISDEDAISRWNTRSGVLQGVNKSVTFKYSESKTWHCFKNDEIEFAFATMRGAFIGLTEYLESSNLLGVVKVVVTPEDGISPIEFLQHAAVCLYENKPCCLTFNISFL